MGKKNQFWTLGPKAYMPKDRGEAVSKAVNPPQKYRLTAEILPLTCYQR
jgi:hypothetical protein